MHPYTKIVALSLSVLAAVATALPAQATTTQYGVSKPHPQTPTTPRPTTTTQY
jgi:hypothetical protein